MHNYRTHIRMNINIEIIAFVIVVFIDYMYYILHTIKNTVQLFKTMI